tara:strand:- start:160 stop:420 length:261 start_codon:yes stop_codon:yes gene_type:complete
MSAIPIVKGLGSSGKAVSMGGNTSAVAKPKGVYIGTDGDYYFELDGTAVAFKGCTSGSILPIRPTKVATNSGLSSAVGTDAIIFLY